MMLVRIEITNFALIEKVVLTPGTGLLILSGETGAGKSILIDAIDALTGSRTSRESVRHGCDRAMIEAVFEPPFDDQTFNLLEDAGLIDAADRLNPEDLIIAREIAAGGKTCCRINGRLVPQAVLRELMSGLVDIHGQHDQQAIFKPSVHMDLLDRYGSDPVAHAFRDWKSRYTAYQDCIKALNALSRDPGERDRQKDMLRFQADEIESAIIKPGEDEKLQDRRKIIANAEKLGSALSGAADLLNGDSSETVLAGLGQVVQQVDRAVNLMPELSETCDQLRECLYSLENASADLRDFLTDIECNPNELDKIDQRLDQLFRLKKKYGETLADVLAYGQQARQDLEALEAGDERYDALKKEQETLKTQLVAAGEGLTRARRKAADILEKHVAKELGDLNMKNVRFEVLFQPYDPTQTKFSRNGLDKVEFLLSANPGEPLKPLASIASGGEASRIMLAIKSILAQVDRIPVLIFDEIDTGVSGQTAGKVAEKLKYLARGRQVFCITHLAPIAAMADQHVLIEKHVEDGQSRTRLQVLDSTGRLEELVRLLAGGVGDKSAAELAKTLLDRSASLNSI